MVWSLLFAVTQILGSIWLLLNTQKCLLLPLLDDPFVVCLRKDHPLCELEEVSWIDMEPYKLISVGRASGNRILLDKSLARDQVQLNSFYEVQHLRTSLGLVEMGLGISIVPKLAMPLSSASVLTSRPLKGQKSTARLALSNAVQHRYRLRPICLLTFYWSIGLLINAACK